MVPELEKARVTELQVRMDCNGCVQKIKKAMHGIDGVYDVYIDFPQQKLTVVGRADPEKIVRAIKKTRKIATICSHTEPGEPVSSEQPPAEPEASGGLPAPDANQPPSEAPPAEAAPPSDPPKGAPPQENPAPDLKPSPQAREMEPKDVEEIHMVHHYPHTYVYKEHWNNYPSVEHGIRHEAPYYATQSYSSYRPSPYISGYGYMRSPPRDIRYIGREAYGDDYHHTRGGGDGNNITSMFSDENPNACSIV